MSPPLILRSPQGDDVGVSPGFFNRARPRFCGVFHLICLLPLLLPATARAALDLQAKAVKTESNEKEEIWAICIDRTKTCVSGKIDAKPKPLRGHPLRMTSADLPGVIFDFDAAKKLSAIEITDPSCLKLPDGLLPGKSRMEDFHAVLGNSSKPNACPRFYSTTENQTPL